MGATDTHAPDDDARLRAEYEKLQFETMRTKFEAAMVAALLKVFGVA